ncbi:NAD(P)H-dependent flavin oxidoreductase [Synergistes jonesii]|uniref:2-nitropropane dioxygenase n=1 Tax=Synergistes jonesii TaxID=2754 RepID=A0A073IPJ6_9BACT|nr:nitronate monooxygenase family protein [Synergistes jonesii]KEJ91401.1 2-nitropropane dioxygenase [Synergistes jonesii]OFB60457.1 2-nitropropane dioxygenase [Synergistes jonesii]OFB61285.1 2-nitropropane dioxygenase [Synergistes jonesii]OFB64202.1 2-nitropropane dioxygenase [Synergistes jonesii]OFB66667.1 2-nitropropane dioxygenase [Synergistes jonesii]
MIKEKSELPSLKIGEYEPKYPIIQGGMGVMVSGPRLAGATAAEGCIGTIASVGLAASYPEYDALNDSREFDKQNNKILANFIKQAKEASKGGIIAVNCMCALSNYESLVRTSCEAGANIIISGAGLPLKLPQLTEGFPKTALVPIVSSVKAAALIASRWLKHYNRFPDAFVVETPNTAGGHLGARDEEQALDTHLSLQEVIPALVKYLKELGRNIPVIAAGGIWDSGDMKKSFDMGASGVQMGTRFAATEEGDASDRFKQAYVDAEEKDVVLIKSPCGLPGRAIMSPLIERYLSGMIEKAVCRRVCLSHCLLRLQNETFCIADALVSAYKGDWENGLFFCGSNVSKVKSIEKVKEIIRELIDGFSLSDLQSES